MFCGKKYNILLHCYYSVVASVTFSSMKYLKTWVEVSEKNTHAQKTEKGFINLTALRLVSQ